MSILLKRTNGSLLLQRIQIFGLFLMVFALNPSSVYSQCTPTQAYESTQTVGNQSWTGQLGLTFTVGASPITITSLGAFDSGSDGFVNPVTVGIVDAAGTTVINPVIFDSATPGTLNGSFATQVITPQVLLANTTYAIVAVGFSAADQNSNAGIGGASATTLNTNLGSVSFSNNIYSNTTTFGGLPNILDGGPVGRYHAGTFSFFVDNEDPVITCPANVTVNLAPTLCAGIASWLDPTATDNCTSVGDIIIEQISGPVSGSNFNVGITSVSYRALDHSGNADTCSFNVIVNDFIAPSLGCKPIQISLDEDCEGELTPTLVLTGYESPTGEILLGCESAYSINVVNSNGQNLGNTVSIHDLTKTLNYTITHTTSSFICWNTVTIEDKIAPTIECGRDLTVNCLTDLSTVTEPTPIDNCFATVELINEVHETLPCDLDFVGKVTRTWKAVDAAGNESAPCVQTIYLERSSVSGITPPANNPVLRCSQVYARDDKGFGYPAPSVTGVPMLGGVSLYPLSQLNMVYCNSIIDYTDVLTVDTKCKTRIIRTWSITEWHCSTAVTKFMSMQLIDIIDDIAPTIPQLTDVTMTTQTRSCDAAVAVPPLDITDNCNTIYRTYVNATKDGAATGYVNGNGGMMTLGVGTHDVAYTSIDECGNTSIMTYKVTVRDDTDPVAICDQFATVSIKTNGYTEVTAKGVDDGSFDECGAVTLKIRRMEDPCSFGADTAWFDKVGFCCLDANTTRMVQLLVTDEGGNTNICMVSVNVQEKVDPTIACPADMTISDCTYTFDPLNADDYFDAAIMTDNCPANNILNHSLVDNRTSCGVGDIVRTFSVSAGSTTYGTCTQTITFENVDPFYINPIDVLDPTDDIVWPRDYWAVGQCAFAGLLPETLPDTSSVPRFTEDACDLVGMQYKDQIFEFNLNGSCYKIIRTWTVIDWCQTDASGNHKTWSYEQQIKVIDNEAPILTLPTSPVLYETINCNSDMITLSATATDCSNALDLKWTNRITKEGVLVSSGSSNIVTGIFDLGTYTIAYTVEDRCGNLSSGSYDFEVSTTAEPTAICKKDVSAPLVLMDTDGNGTGDTFMTMVTPAHFDNKSYHKCDALTSTLQLSFSADVNDVTAVYNTPGCKEIELWVTDSNGNTSFCTTFLDVQQNGVSNDCGSNNRSNIVGKTVKENNEIIEEAIVELKGSEQTPVSTDENGQYAFASMPTGGSYQVVPSKDGDDINGVSTLDIVMIQRHILGIQKLSSPYQLIAADANNSGKVSAADLTEVRKLVLGVNTSFPNNTSWRFVDAAYTFVDPTDPWLTPFGERYDIDQLTSDMTVDFIGVKIGDVNGSAKGKKFNNNVASRSSFSYSIEDKKVNRGDIIEVPVYATNRHTMYGMQGELEANGLIIRGLVSGKVAVTPEQYLISNIHTATISLASGLGTTLNSGEVLFAIEVEVLRDGTLSEMLQFSDKMTPEVYVDKDLETKGISIDWRAGETPSFVLVSNNPNPWNSQTSIVFEMPTDAMVTFKVKDYTGRKLISTVDQYTKGTNTIQINRSDLGQAGVYIYELRFGDELITGKMIMID